MLWDFPEPVFVVFFLSVIAKPFPKEQGLRGWNSWFQASLQAKSQEAAEVSSCLWKTTTMQVLSQLLSVDFWQEKEIQWIVGLVASVLVQITKYQTAVRQSQHLQAGDVPITPNMYCGNERCVQNYIFMHNNVRWCSVKSEGVMEVGVNGCVRPM